MKLEKNEATAAANGITDGTAGTPSTPTPGHKRKLEDSDGPAASRTRGSASPPMRTYHEMFGSDEDQLEDQENAVRAIWGMSD